MPGSYLKVCAAKLHPLSCAKATFGIVFDQAEALQDGLIDQLYSSPEQLEEQIAAFAKRFAAVGVHKEAIKINKLNQFKETIDACRTWSFEPIKNMHFSQMYGKMSEIIKKSIAPKPK